MFGRSCGVCDLTLWCRVCTVKTFCKVDSLGDVAPMSLCSPVALPLASSVRQFERSVVWFSSAVFPPSLSLSGLRLLVVPNNNQTTEDIYRRLVAARGSLKVFSVWFEIWKKSAAVSEFTRWLTQKWLQEQNGKIAIDYVIVYAKRDGI